MDIYIDPLVSPGVMSAKMWIRDGSRSDPTDQRGAHQLLGSVLSRGCGPYDPIAIGDLIEGYGAGLHCETYEDGYLITLKCLKNNAYELLPIIGWMINQPHLKDNQINLERELSIQALKRQKENPFYLAFDGWRNIAYGNGPYGHDPLGSIEDLKNINKAKLSRLSKSLLTKKKVLVIAGDLPHDLGKQIYKIEPFNSLVKRPSAKTPSEIFNKSTIVQNSHISTFISQSIKTAQVAIIMGRPTVPHGHSDSLSLHLLSCYLGSGMSSRLFLELREKHGVAYDVGAHHPIKELDAPFVVHASTSAEKSIHTLELLKKCWRDILEFPISNEALNLAKAKYRSQIAHASQTVGQRAERKAHLLGINLPSNHHEESIRTIDSLTSKELQDAANKYLQKPLLSLCGPNKSIKTLAELWNNPKYAF